MKHPDWQKRLVTVIRAAEMRPFSWGEHDCCLFAAGCVEAINGKDYAAEFRGTYSNETGAKKAILRKGGTLEKVLARFLSEVNAEFIQRGDIAVIENAGRKCAGVFYGGVVWVPGDEGLIGLKTKLLSVWRAN